jgi:hypothetical protein
MSAAVGRSLNTDAANAPDPRLEAIHLGDKFKVVALALALVAATFFYAFPNAVMFALFLVVGYVAYEANTVGNNLHEFASNPRFFLLMRNPSLIMGETRMQDLHLVTKNTTIARFFGNRLLLNAQDRV